MRKLGEKVVMCDNTIFYYDGPEKIVKHGIEHRLIGFVNMEPVYGVKIGEKVYGTKNFKEYRWKWIKCPYDHIITEHYFHNLGYRTFSISVSHDVAHILVIVDDEVLYIEASAELLKTPEKLLEHVSRRVKIPPELKQYQISFNGREFFIRDENLIPIATFSKESITYYGHETTLEEMLRLIKTKTFIPPLSAFEKPGQWKPPTRDEIVKLLRKKKKILTPHATIIVKNPKNIPEELWPYIEKAFRENDDYMIVTIDGRKTTIQLMKMEIPTALKIGKTTYYYDAEKKTYIPTTNNASKIKYDGIDFEIEVMNPNKRKIFLKLNALHKRIIRKLENGEKILSSDVIPACNVIIQKRAIKTSNKKITDAKIKLTPTGVEVPAIYKEGIYIIRIPYDNEKDVLTTDTIDDVPEEYIAKTILETYFLAHEKIEHMKAILDCGQTGIWKLKNGENVTVKAIGRRMEIEITEKEDKIINKNVTQEEYSIINTLENLEMVKTYINF